MLADMKVPEACVMPGSSIYRLPDCSQEEISPQGCLAEVLGLLVSSTKADPALHLRLTWKLHLASSLLLLCPMIPIKLLRSPAFFLWHIVIVTTDLLSWV